MTSCASGTCVMRRLRHWTFLRAAHALRWTQTVPSLTHLIEIIGEPAKNVPEDIRAQHTNVPWRETAGTRDRLVHRYFKVDLDILWGIVTDDLPPLVKSLNEIVVPSND